MILCVDIGNTHTVLGIFPEKSFQVNYIQRIDPKGTSFPSILSTWRLRSLREKTSDELGVEISSLFSREGYCFEAFSKVIISSVVPEITRMYSHFVGKFFKKDALVISASVIPDMTIKVERPEAVGSDRLANAYAARILYGAPSIVVDFGTATTFDVIGTSGSFEGGVIAPGILLSSQALSSRAALLPAIELSSPVNVIGRNTIEAMQSGTFTGYVCLVEGLLRRIKDEMDFLGLSRREQENLRVIATGGLAPLISRATQDIEIVDRDLTLKGICLIGQRI
ncbi:MAG TPA: type III pantothenate kinase [Oligoflexia bacterium]|nr:type III pantothenate kinase [Oligoflexia bacterium]HMP47746.1 type III pantothenate kinase [Oligoflexia bacterium]